MNTLLKIIIFVSVLRIDIANAQTVEYPWLPQNIEEMDENDAERVYELVYRDIKPVNINRTNITQLLEIPGMTEDMATIVITFRDSVGLFLSIYELLSVPCITLEYLQNIESCLTFDPAVNPEGSHEISFRTVTKGQLSSVETSAGNQQVGSPHKISVRYKGEYRSWTAVVKAEKDAGEPFGGKYRPEGFDFYSGCLRYRGQGFVRQVIAGDYRIAAGHGLICNQLFAAGNNPSLLYQPHEFRDARAHTSMDEHYFFRGAAVTLRHNPFQLTLFGSLKPVDGNITETDSLTGRTIAVSSIQKSGIHSTVSEIEDRYAFRESAWGGIIKYQHKKFQAGINLLHIIYNTDIKPADNFSNRHKFSGNNIMGTSFILGWYNQKTGFTAEMAFSGGRPAISLVMVARANDNTSLYISGRYLSPAYHAPYANTLCRSSAPSGEEGFNIEFSYTPVYGRVFRAIADLGRNFSTDNAPASGRVFRNISLETSCRHGILNSMVRISCDNREEMCTSFPAEEYGSTSPVTTNRFVARTTCQITPCGIIKFYLRGDFCYNSGQPASEGWLMAAGTETHLLENRLSISLRHYIVKTDHYCTRIYTHEQDAPGAFGMNILYGRGTRSYILFGYKHSTHIRSWFKCGYSSIEKPDSYMEINKRVDLSFQLNITI